jgi:hypothetical protein
MAKILPKIKTTKPLGKKLSHGKNDVACQKGCRVPKMLSRGIKI